MVFFLERLVSSISALKVNAFNNASGLKAQLKEQRRSDPEVVGLNPPGSKIFIVLPAAQFPL